MIRSTLGIGLVAGFCLLATQFAGAQSSLPLPLAAATVETSIETAGTSIGTVDTYSGVEPTGVGTDVGAGAANVRPFRFGVLSFREKDTTRIRWQPLTDHLSAKIPEYPFELVVYHLDELEAAVANRTLDFVFTQPSHYVLLTYRMGLSSPLATLVNSERGYSTQQFGGVIFTRSDRDDIASFTDLRGKRLAAAALNSLGAYQMQAFELLEQGIRLPRDATVLFTGQPQKNALDAVLSGAADAGFLRTGVLEELLASGAVDSRQVKLIGAQWRPGFPFLTSTRLYPEWPVVAMPEVPPDVTRRVAAELLSIPHGGDLAQSMGITGFTFPGDYRSIDELLFRLRLPPFDSGPGFSLSDAWQQWQRYLLPALILAALVLIGFVFALVVRNRALLRAQQAIETSSQKIRTLHLALEQSPNSVIITDMEGRIQYVNTCFTHQSGYRADQVLGKTPALLKSGKTPRATYDALWQSLSEGGIWKGEFCNRHRDGTEYVAAATVTPVRDSVGTIISYLAVEQDVTEQRQQLARINQLAYFDSLTQLPNRSLLLEQLGQRMADAESHRHALVLLNIDRFKVINDARGADVGDALLIELGTRVQAMLREDDTVARMGADEFALLLPELDKCNAQTALHLQMVLEKIQAQMLLPFEVSGERVSITLSLGATLFPEHAQDTPIKVLRRADTALHLAKAQGGNRSLLFAAEMGQEASEQFALEHELRHAHTDNELRLYLQPQFAHDGQVAGAEILLRWQHPGRGLVMPGLFIPLAEQSDLIVTLGDWVLEQSLFLLARLQRAQRPLRLAVNVSPRHFRQTNFVERIQALLEESGAKAEHLMLEITEGLFIDGLDEVTATMLELTELGIGISIDDFGTGYSSLAYLRRMPLRELKIDRSFIQDAPHDPEAAALIDLIFLVAQRMQLEVVAEGVETPEQAQFLATYPGLLQQGFLHGRPVAVETWLAQWLAQEQPAAGR